MHIDNGDNRALADRRVGVGRNYVWKLALNSLVDLRRAWSLILVHTPLRVVLSCR